MIEHLQVLSMYFDYKNLDHQYFVDFVIFFLNFKKIYNKFTV